MVYRIKKIVGDLFDLHFALWHNGGPDYIREKKIWDQQQDNEWHHVVRRKPSYASVASSIPKDTVFKRLVFPGDYHLNFSDELPPPSTVARNTPQPQCQSMEAKIMTRTSRESIQISKFEQHFLRQDRCFRCLAMGHKVAVCKNDFRCQRCFLLGHKAFRCHQSKL